jgi:hypothetical protein
LKVALNTIALPLMFVHVYDLIETLVVDIEWSENVSPKIILMLISQYIKKNV